MQAGGFGGGVIEQTPPSAHPSLWQPGGSGMDVRGDAGQRSPFKPGRPISFQSRRQGRAEPQSVNRHPLPGHNRHGDGRLGHVPC